MALAVRVDPILVAAVVLLVQGQIAAGPHPADARGRTVRAPKFVAVAAASLVATGLTLWPRGLVGAEGTHAGDIADVVPGSLVAIIPATAVGLIVALVSQMLRRDGRRELVVTVAHATTAARSLRIPERAIVSPLCARRVRRIHLPCIQRLAPGTPPLARSSGAAAGSGGWRSPRS